MIPSIAGILVMHLIVKFLFDSTSFRSLPASIDGRNLNKTGKLILHTSHDNTKIACGAIECKEKSSIISLDMISQSFVLTRRAVIIH